MLVCHELELHGHTVTYRTAGSGPVAAAPARDRELLRDVGAGRRTASASTSRSSRPTCSATARSATPRGDYSLGAHASGARDLLTALGHERVTVVGHSLGGGIAMQFAYQFPERCERLGLVSSGGLGKEVHLLLRAAALPGADWVLPVLTSAGLSSAGRGVAAAPQTRPHRSPRATSPCSPRASPASTPTAPARPSCTPSAP